MGVGEALVVSSALQVGSGIFAGVQANKAGKEQQKLLDEQAGIVRGEAKATARRFRLRNKVNNAKLKLQFLHQGVGIAGSPANVIASDINLQDEEVRSIIESGEAKSQLLELQGENARSEGRAGLIGGIIQGISSGVSTFAIAKSRGFFDKPDVFTSTVLPNQGIIEPRA